MCNAAVAQSGMLLMQADNAANTTQVIGRSSHFLHFAQLASKSVSVKLKCAAVEQPQSGRIQ